MNDLGYILKLLQDAGGMVTSQIINDLNMEWDSLHTKQKDLYDRYTNESVPIQYRTFTDDNKINRQLNNDFFSEIVDTKTGYFMGVPISYIYDGSDNEKKYLDTFLMLESADDKDATTAKNAAIMGLGVRLLYVGQDGEAHIMNVSPWECMFITDAATDQIQYALRVFDVEYHIPQLNSEDDIDRRQRIEWYDAENVYFYERSLQDVQKAGKTEKEWLVQPFYNDNGDNVQPHMFDGVPLLPFLNNNEWMGDAEKVLQLIDAYDRTISDLNSEFESFRLAYMIFKGATIDADTIALAQKTGAFSLDDPQATADFLTKNLEAEPIENHLDRLEKNIRVFAKTPNFNDENFGNESGEAKKYKLMALENKVINSERKFTKALRDQFKLLFSVWNIKGFNFKIENLKFQFTRNLPIDLTYEADVTQKLAGLVSDETRLSLLSFVENPEDEMKKMEEDVYPDTQQVDDTDEDTI